MLHRGKVVFERSLTMNLLLDGSESLLSRDAEFKRVEWAINECEEEHDFVANVLGGATFGALDDLRPY